MKCLVTGGAGFIGSTTTRVLIEQGYLPIVLDNLTMGHRESLPENIKFYQGDILDKNLLDKIFSENEIDSVIHFAGRTEPGLSMKEPLEFFQTNVAGITNLIYTMKEHNVKNIVFSSSSSVYGIPKMIPIKEDTEKRPISPYGHSKLMSEIILDSAKVYGIKNICLRYFNASGAAFDIGEDHNPETHLIPLVLKTVLGQKENISIFGTDYDTQDGTCIRDYIHILDLAEAHVLALKTLEQGKTGKYNVGIGKGYSVREIIDMCKKVTGKEIKIMETNRRPGDPPELVADSEKIKQELGWQPEFELEQIIKSAWNWHKNNPNGFED